MPITAGAAYGEGRTDVDGLKTFLRKLTDIISLRPTKVRNALALPPLCRSHRRPLLVHLLQATMSSNNSSFEPGLKENVSANELSEVSSKEAQAVSVSQEMPKDAGRRSRRGFPFWMCFTAVMISMFLISFDVVSSIITYHNAARLIWNFSEWGFRRFADNCSRPQGRRVRMGGLCVYSIRYGIVASERWSSSGKIQSRFHHKQCSPCCDRFLVVGRLFYFKRSSLLWVVQCAARLLAWTFWSQEEVQIPMPSCCTGTYPSLSAVQGIGAGGMIATSQIIVADLVPLHERGTLNGLLSL